MTRLSFKQLPLFLLLFGALITAQAQTFQGNPCKVFIGVETSPVSGGLNVDNIWENTPAKTYGVQPGDVIVALDGVPVRSQSELLRERDKHQQGESFSLQILREGREKTIQARFKACNAEELEAAQQRMENLSVVKEMRLEEMKSLMELKFQGMEMNERPILGVYENNEVNVDGVPIGTVLPGKGAEAAGLQAGDIVVKVDQKTVTGGATLRNALVGHKPGDRVSVVYLRNGKTVQTETVLSADRGYFTQSIERDPCKVFIGVYTSDHGLDGRGTRVDGVIDETPAKLSGVQPGDIIMSFNGQAVNTYRELTLERDKNKPGDAFQMTVMRNGNTMTINARFKSCDNAGNTPVQETVQVLEEDRKAEVRENQAREENTLILEKLEAFPSPTFGPLNINFEAEAVPTTVRILDISGRSVYSKEIPQFGGSFNEQVNLSNNKSGNYILSIQQGKKVFSKQVVLLPRA